MIGRNAVSFVFQLIRHSWVKIIIGALDRLPLKNDHIYFSSQF